MILFRDIPEDNAKIYIFAARGVAAVAGIFTFAVSVLMVANYLQLATADPLDTPALSVLRERYLAEQNTSQKSEIAGDIRALDLLARKAYFTRTWQLRVGTYFLIGGSLLLILSLRLLALLRRKPVVPDASNTTAIRSTSRLILSSIGILILLGALVASFLSRTISLPAASDAVKAAGATSTTPAAPFPVGYEENWPGFRGPYGNGKAGDLRVPTEWDGPAETNVKWIATVPAPGFSSPVVWEDKVFLSGSTGDRQFLYCWDTVTGTLLWERGIGPFPGSPVEAPRVTADTGYAASTPATDGTYIYTVFATGDIAALDFEGNIIWGRNLGVPDNHYGHSSSLLTYADTVIVLYDHAGSAALFALDVRTGLDRWRTDRDTETTWSSPVIAKVGSDWGILINTTPYFAAYTADDGQEIYRYEGIFGEVASSPTYDEQQVIVVNQLMSVVALDLADGTVSWEQYDELPDTTSPLVVTPYVIIATSYGVVTATDMESGEIAWRTEFDEGFYSSPVYAGGFVYLVDRSGTTRVFEPSDEFVEISSPILGERVDTTPAFAGGRIFIRGENTLFCIEDAGD